jgi:hypothetical protein
MINIKKPSKVSGLKKRPRPTRFYALVFSVILVFGLFNGFLVKNALAVYSYSNNYTDNWLLYTAPDGDHILISFHVKTTFNLYGMPYNCHAFSYAGILIDFSDYPSGYTFQAGQNYTIQDLQATGQGDYTFTIHNLGFASLFTTWQTWCSNSFIYGGIPNNTLLADFTQVPVLAITYPHDNDEIAGAFNIQGSYTIPAGSGYNYLIAGVFTAGSYDPLNFNDNVQAFGYNLATTTGNVLIPVNGIPAGYYDIYFRFLGSGLNYEPATHILNVHLVNDIPPALPETGETPPEVQIYPPTAPDTYHADYCAYGTSTTPLFNTLTGAVSGMITSIGDNLATFAGRFSNTDAKDTGEQLASSVLIMRSYVAGLNSFFGELPVGEILILYLIVFVLVILFRVIKGLINLIKP